MNFQAILLANITGFTLILFLRISRILSQVKQDTEENAFNVMMYFVMIACIVEPLTFYVDGKPGLLCYWINLLGNTYLYYANATGTFLWLLFMDLSLFHDRLRLKKIYYKLAVPVSGLILSLIINIFTGFYFYVDEANVYHRQPAVYIFYAYLFFCAVFTLIIYYSFKAKHGETAFFPVYMYIAPIFIGSVLQMFIYGISLAWLGTALGITALYISLQQQKVYKDELTGLYNRLYLNHILYKMNRFSSRHYYGLMMDLNDFKGINDNFGHSMGDIALVEIAKIFRSIINDDCFAFRYAGDEFIILIKTNRLEDVLELESTITEKLKDYNTTSSYPFQLSVSIGHGEYDNEHDTEDSFLKKIDSAMYEAKKIYHANDSGHFA